MYELWHVKGNQDANTKVEHLEELSKANLIADALAKPFSVLIPEDQLILKWKFIGFSNALKQNNLVVITGRNGIETLADLEAEEDGNFNLDLTTSILRAQIIQEENLNIRDGPTNEILIWDLQGWQISQFPMYDEQVETTSHLLLCRSEVSTASLRQRIKKKEGALIE